MSTHLAWLSMRCARSSQSGCRPSEIKVKQIICGHRPFPHLGEWVAVGELLEGKLPVRPEVGFTDSLWRTLESCWKVERRERPSVDTVLRRLDEALKG